MACDPHAVQLVGALVPQKPSRVTPLLEDLLQKATDWVSVAASSDPSASKLVTLQLCTCRSIYMQVNYIPNSTTFALPGWQTRHNCIADLKF
jgi:hypothetical protein